MVERVAVHHVEAIVGQTVKLIPYEKEHVPLFNCWLKDPTMQQLVATPAVTIEAEYIFQEECTHSTDIRADNQIIGDVDMFFSPEGEAEVNIMIASSEWRRHGYASEALTLAMEYAIQRFNVHKFIAKISSTNEPSIRFFERHGFRPIEDKPNIFGEFIYELNAGNVPSSDLDIESDFKVSV